MQELTSRQNALISRGYDESTVYKLSNYSSVAFDFIVNVIFSRISNDVIASDLPMAVFIGGQPGSGKSSEVMRLKNIDSNFVEIIIDNYRAYHPHYLEIEECIKKHWVNRSCSENDTPGNDIADFTTDFVGKITDELILFASLNKYNMIVEWGMRDSSVPISTMRTLSEKGYTNFVKFICVHKDISYQACVMRSKISSDALHIVRQVPKNFHDLYIKDLPQSVDNIYNLGFKEGIVFEIELILRNGQVVYNSNVDDFMPGSIYSEYLNNKSLTTDFKNSLEIAKNNNQAEYFSFIKKR